MANERDFELLDDYLSQRMSEADRSAFEHKLRADPDLQHEHTRQQKLIEGIKQARVAELKSMLNKVPVPANSPGNTLVSKIVFGTVVSIIVAAGYWYFSHEEQGIAEPQNVVKENNTTERPVIGAEKPVPQDQEKKTAQERPTPPVAPKAEQEKNQTSAGTEHSKPSLAKRPEPLQTPDGPAQRKSVDGPVLDVFDPNIDATGSNEKTADKVVEPLASTGNSSLIVETDRENNRYSFHYQFRDGKLFLFGPFEHNLYEIMEFFANEKRTVFLYYNNRYYRLEEADTQVRPLNPITDPALLEKLKEYRSSK